MMLSKVPRILITKLSESSSSKVGSILLLNKRDFSIDEIGKRNEKPWDYKKRHYGLWGSFTDSTMRRLGENSIVISVEGNFGSGKTEFAKKLAKDIDFVYAREPDLDYHVYDLPNGENMRKIINEYVGDNLLYRADSVEDWHREPTFKRAISLQHKFYNIRWMQTRTALLHLMSTGQGVVLERSAFSDSVICQSVYENNLMSDEAYRFYLRDLVPTTLIELWKPHVIIYLDKTPEECLKAIKEKGQPFEKESKVYNLNFLKTMDKNYKKTFLPSMKQAHVLTYKSEDIKHLTVIEDLDALDFEDETKFIDWRVRKESQINFFRRTMSSYDYCMKLLEAPVGYLSVPEYLKYGENLLKLEEKLEEDQRCNGLEKASPFSPIPPRFIRREWLQ